MADINYNNPPVVYDTGSPAGNGAYFISCGFGNWVTSSNATLAGAANTIDVIGFMLYQPMTVRKITVNVVTNVAASTANFGLWNAAANKVIDSGAISMAATGVVSTTLTTPVYLQAGFYWFGWSCTSTSVVTVGVAFAPSTSASAQQVVMNKNVNRVGTGGSTSGGVMPSTLTVTTGVNIETPIPYVLFEA